MASTGTVRTTLKGVKQTLKGTVRKAIKGSVRTSLKGAKQTLQGAVKVKGTIRSSLKGVSQRLSGQRKYQGPVRTSLKQVASQANGFVKGKSSMTVVTNALSANITLLDQNPASIPSTGFLGLGTLTAGEGIAGNDQVLTDALPASVAFQSAAANYGRLLRIPANARLQHLFIGTDIVLDSANPQTLAFDISVGFSDSLGDGTPYYLQGLVSDTTKTGVSVAANAASRNKAFGLMTLSGNGGTTNPVPPIDVTLAAPGTPYSLAPAVTGVALAAGSSAIPLITLWQTPLARIFGYTSKQGYVIDNPGWCDIIINVTVASTTAVAGNIIGRAEYIF